MEVIKPNDIIKYNPTGEEWVVCGVNYGQGKLIPCNYKFPFIVDLNDCKLIESRYLFKPQSVEQIESLKQHGLLDYIDSLAAMFHGFL